MMIIVIRMMLTMISMLLIMTMIVTMTFVRLLQTAQGSLLDDEQLVNTLNSSKTTSQEVAEQLQVSEQTEIKIDAAREVGITSSCLFVSCWPCCSRNLFHTI